MTPNLWDLDQCKVLRNLQETQMFGLHPLQKIHKCGILQPTLPKQILVGLVAESAPSGGRGKAPAILGQQGEEQAEMSRVVTCPTGLLATRRQGPTMVTSTGTTTNQYGGELVKMLGKKVGEAKERKKE